MQYYAEKFTEFRTEEAQRGHANQAFVRELRRARTRDRTTGLRWFRRLAAMRVRGAATPAAVPAPAVGRWSW